MDLGLGFDDEDLQSSEKKTQKDIHVHYNVKLCAPKWFESALESHLNDQSNLSELDKEQVPHAFKFSGDFHYYHKNYVRAAEQYESALVHLAKNNVSVRQDVKESLCRCYMNTDHVEKSFQLAKEMVQEMSIEDESHQRQSLILMASVSERAEKWAECIDALERLCSLQPFYAQSWNHLGDAYCKISEQPTLRAVDNDSRNNLKIGVNSTVSTESLVKQLTCYIRARVFEIISTESVFISLLLQAVASTASSLIKQRNQSLLAQISAKIDTIPISDEGKAFAYQHIQGEIENPAPDLKDDGGNHSKTIEASDSNTTFTSHLFFSKFCSWFLKKTHVNHTITV